MSFQVGFACYADLQAAGAAACARFDPVTGITGNGSTVTTTTCAGSTVDGALQLSLSTAPVGGGPATTSLVTLPMAYQPCMYQDFVDASLIIFAALLAVWAVWYGPYKVMQLLSFTRGNNEN